MKSIVIYYSYSGNTKKIAALLSSYLKQLGETELVELKAADESDIFIKQASRGFRHIKAELQAVNFELSQYDLICFGTPVWAFGPTPAINAYLDKCVGIEDKSVVLFTTYGSGTGNTRCLNYMQTILTKKGAKDAKRFSVQQFKVSDSNFVQEVIKEAIGE